MFAINRKWLNSARINHQTINYHQTFSKNDNMLKKSILYKEILNQKTPKVYNTIQLEEFTREYSQTEDFGSEFEGHQRPIQTNFSMKWGLLTLSSNPTMVEHLELPLCWCNKNKPKTIYHS